MDKHYSPRTPLRLVEGIDLVDDILEARASGLRIGIVSLYGPAAMPEEPVAYAAELYGRLHDLDAQGLNVILVEMPPDTPEWAAVRDRLSRAAAP
jgi:L-threonylcarbamoyladenylate synthase